MNNAKFLILALLLASLAATPALAQRHGWSATGDQDRRPGQRIEALTEQLDLTPETEVPSAEHLLKLLRQPHSQRQVLGAHIEQRHFHLSKRIAPTRSPH